MSQTVNAVYDGEVLRPDVALPLEPNTRVRLVVELLDTPERPGSFLDTALSLNLSGPPDWSAKLEEYLYGDADRPK